MGVYCCVFMVWLLRPKSTVSLRMLPPAGGAERRSGSCRLLSPPAGVALHFWDPGCHPRGKRGFLALVPPAGSLSSSKMLNNSPC